jgi:hypothetical protein
LFIDAKQQQHVAHYFQLNFFLILILIATQKFLIKLFAEGEEPLTT